MAQTAGKGIRVSLFAVGKTNFGHGNLVILGFKIKEAGQQRSPAHDKPPVLTDTGRCNPANIDIRLGGYSSAKGMKDCRKCRQNFAALGESKQPPVTAIVIRGKQNQRTKLESQDGSAHAGTSSWWRNVNPPQEQGSRMKRKLRDALRTVQNPAQSALWFRRQHWRQLPLRTPVLSCVLRNVWLKSFLFPFSSAPKRPASPKGALFLCTTGRLLFLTATSCIGFHFGTKPEGTTAPISTRLGKVRTCFYPSP